MAHNVYKEEIFQVCLQYVAISEQNEKELVTYLMPQNAIKHSIKV